MSKSRKIIHIDMDCFFAAVEMRNDPRLRNIPMAVGGSPGSRGVIATANYLARKFGVRSALSSAYAQRLCPGLVIVPGSHDAYRQESKVIREIFHSFTSLVEPLSLDEAFLDVSDCDQCEGSATLIAEKIRGIIFAKTKLSASAGIAPNKFLAKVASDLNKPNGQFTISPDNVEGFLQNLAVEKIPGVGKVTNQKMQSLKIFTCQDLKKRSLAQLTHHFGIFGKTLFDIARGIDNRPVSPNRIRKTLSVERTFDIDLADISCCQPELLRLYDEFLLRLGKLKDDYVVRSVFVKIKFDNFEVTTLEKSSVTKPSIDIYSSLLHQAFVRKSRPYRLIGIGVGLTNIKHQAKNSKQLWLFDPAQIFAQTSV